MRALLTCLLCGAAAVAHEQSPTPLATLTPPAGRFFDDPFAVSADGKRIAVIATDAATHASLQLWTLDGPTPAPPAVVDGLAPAVTQVAFLGAGRVLVVTKQDGGDRVVGHVATLRGRALTLDKARLGPADAIDVVDRDGKRLVVVYSRGGRKTIDHAVQILSADDLRPVAKRTLVESAEGALRCRAGDVRPLWWSRGHTQLAAQKIGEYDAARDIRRPDRFVRLDLVSDRIVDEHEIEDVLAFAQISITRKSGPQEEAFARLADDRKAFLLLDGLDERQLPLARDLALYEPASLRSRIVDDKTMLVGLQVDPNNIVAVGRRGQDPDDFDLYTVDRASMHGRAVQARRVLTLPGQGRPVGFAEGGGRVAILRKDKGFDRGGVAIELYALP